MYYSYSYTYSPLILTLYHSPTHHASPHHTHVYTPCFSSPHPLTVLLLSLHTTHMHINRELSLTHALLHLLWLPTRIQSYTHTPLQRITETGPTRDKRRGLVMPTSEREKIMRRVHEDHCRRHGTACVMSWWRSITSRATWK